MYLTILLVISLSVCICECGLEISPSSLLLPSPSATAQSRQELSSIVFTCIQVQNGSEPQRPYVGVVWLHNGVVIVTENNKKYRHYRRKRWLAIYDITYDDQGIYECVHDTLNCTDHERGVAELWIAPMISEVPQIQTVTVGDDVMVKCIVRGQNYDVTWSLSGMMIASTNETYNESRYTILSNGSLIISDSNLGDSGCYTCTVSNKAGNTSANIQLIATINGRPTTPAVTASLCTSPDNDEKLDNNATMTTGGCCHGYTNDDNVTDDGCYILEDISFRPRSKDGLNITESPPITDDDNIISGPMFLHSLSYCIHTTVGYTIDIPCVAMGNPTPVVWWVKDNITITGPDQTVTGATTYHYYEQKNDNTLRIHSVRSSDAGRYECIAENNHGRSVAMVTVRVWGVDDICGCMRNDDISRVKRITEGSEVTSHEDYPWQVLIEYKHRHSDKLCGGTLLKPDWLLTAAHCLHAGNHWLSPGDFIIRVGVVNRMTFEPTQQQLSISYILPHPEYNTSFQHLVNKVPEYDIALIKLSHPARLTSAVQPACLPDTNSDPSVGTMCHISGWGHLNFEQAPSPPLLHYTLVPIVNYSNCRHEDSYGNAVTRKHLCAGFDEGGPDACQNDSGGPLVCEIRRKWRVYGVVNHGIGCGEEMKYGLYARVVRYNSWIKAELQI